MLLELERLLSSKKESTKRRDMSISRTIVSNDYVTIAQNGDHVIIDTVNALISFGGFCFTSPQIVVGIDQLAVIEVVSFKTGKSTRVVIDYGRVDYLKS